MSTPNPALWKLIENGQQAVFATVSRDLVPQLSGRTTLSKIASTPGDEVCEELFSIHSSFFKLPDRDAFYEEMIASRRLVIRVHVDRVYRFESPKG